MPISLGDGSFSNDAPISNEDNGPSGYDVLGTGAAEDPTRGGRVSLADISGGSSDDDSYVAALQSKVNEQVAQNQIAQLQNALLPQQVTQGFAAGTSPLAQLSARRNLDSPFPSFGLLGMLGGMGLQNKVASGIYDRVMAGGTPVYDPSGQIVGVMGEGLFGGEAYYGRPGFDPLQGGSGAIRDKDTGVLLGYQSEGFTGDIDDSGDDDFRPSVPVTAVSQAQEQQDGTMIPQGYVYPDGGFFPREGRFLRMGLLDRPIDGYGGLLADQDPSEFEAMNMAFRQPTYAGIYQDPYDLTGYTLLDE